MIVFSILNAQLVLNVMGTIDMLTQMENSKKQKKNNRENATNKHHNHIHFS